MFPPKKSNIPAVNGAAFGIEVETAGIVTSNHITNSSSYGIWFSTSGATAKSNTITQSNVGIELACMANTVASNTINSSQVGLVDVPATFKGVNNFYNVANVSDSCTPVTR
jgi:parallel beta-helix repeat protein